MMIALVIVMILMLFPIQLVVAMIGIILIQVLVVVGILRLIIM